MIKISKIFFQYQTNPPLFSDLDWCITTGTICGLFGKNGAGKSTLLKLIAGLLFPKQGRCEALGYKPQQRRAEFLTEVFYLAKDFWLPNISVKKYLQLFAPFYPRFNQNSFKNNCQTFDINLDDNLSTTSYGQKKKFLLAFALATNCRIIMLDEPTNGLDILSKSQLRKLIIADFDESKIFIIATHQAHDLENLIDTVVMLDQGKIIFQQALAEIAKKLHFAETFASAITQSDVVLYQEKIFGGLKIIQPNQNETETSIDLELLFKALLTNAININACFNRSAR